MDFLLVFFKEAKERQKKKLKRKTIHEERKIPLHHF
jgi:hypothetical protein